MPIYEFECGDCAEIFEVLVPRPDEAAQPCPACGSGNTRKLLSVTAGIVAKNDVPAACPLAGGCAGAMGRNRGGCSRLNRPGGRGGCPGMGRPGGW